MIRFFNPENKFWQFMNKITDVACISILWAIVSLPVFTMGAATTALYEFSLNQVRDSEGKIISGFFTSFRRHFKKATVLWLGELLGLVFFGADLWAAWNFLLVKGGVPGTLLFGFCFSLAILFLCVCFYLYPILAFYDFPLKKIIGNSFVMSMANLPVTLTLILMTGLQMVLFYYFSGLYFFWQGLFIFFSSYFIMGLFWKYTEKNPEEAEISEEEKELV